MSRRVARTSAVLAGRVRGRTLIHPGHRPQGDPGKFLEALKPYGGTVLRTSLTHDAEQKLMKALHGDDQSAATWEQPQPAGMT